MDSVANEHLTCRARDSIDEYTSMRMAALDLASAPPSGSKSREKNVDLQAMTARASMQHFLAQWQSWQSPAANDARRQATQPARRRRRLGRINLERLGVKFQISKFRYPIETAPNAAAINSVTG